jgi:hypothetical protein
MVLAVSLSAIVDCSVYTTQGTCYHRPHGWGTIVPETCGAAHTGAQMWPMFLALRHSDD